MSRASANFVVCCFRCGAAVKESEVHTCSKFIHERQKEFVICAAGYLCCEFTLVPINGQHKCMKCEKPVHAFCGNDEEYSTTCLKCVYPTAKSGKKGRKQRKRRMTC